MKLLTQTSLYLAGLSVLVFLLIGITFYSILKRLSNNELDEILLQERLEVLANPELLLIADQANAPFLSRVIANEVDSIYSVNEIFYDSISTLQGYEKPMPIRCLKFYYTVQGQPIEFILFKSKTPSQTFVKQVIRTIAALIILFLFGVFLTNQFIFSRVWAGFFNTIRALGEYVPDRKKIILPKTSIQEFNTLNKEIEKMTERVSVMYDNLQNFTTHTTHEFQTPLAVIRTKSELLLQTENLSDIQLQLIQSISDNAGQLSQLNRSLALLFKIDNRHFPDHGEADPGAILRKQIELLEEWIDLKQIKVSTNIQPGVTMPVDPALADILIHNLAKNAIVHNIQSGYWHATVEPNHLMICNSGRVPEFNTDQYFVEFVKGSESRGLGLGLSLIKKICEVSNLSVSYQYIDGKHQFDIRW